MPRLKEPKIYTGEVISMIGRNAGKRVPMDYVAAQSNVAAGTARWVDDDTPMPRQVSAEIASREAERKAEIQSDRDAYKKFLKQQESEEPAGGEGEGEGEEKIDLPDDWRTLHHSKLISIGKKIKGMDTTESMTKAEAIEVIEAYQNDQVSEGADNETGEKEDRNENGRIKDGNHVPGADGEAKARAAEKANEFIAGENDDDF